MHTLDPHESRNDRNRMGPQGFRTLAVNEQPQQTALRRTQANLPRRQPAPLVVDQRQELLGGGRVALLSLGAFGLAGHAWRKRRRAAT